MNILQSTKKMLYLFMNIPFIPPALKESKEPKLLHISDTPSSYYPFIYKLIEELNPQILIHTGDLVDNLKLEFSPHLYDVYENKMAAFITHLENTDLQEIYLVPGNHDHRETMVKYCLRSKIVMEGKNVILENIIFNLAHHPWCLSQNAYYHLYGHNFHNIPNKENQIYLNGLNHMHVILLHSKEVISLPYPFGINQDRKMTPKGLGI